MDLEARVIKEKRSILRDKIINDLLMERVKQDSKWGIQKHSPETWMTILMEEIGEISKEVVELKFGHKFDSSNYRNEMIQACALLIAMIEDYDEG